MNNETRKLRKLALAYDTLEADERRNVDAFLMRSPDTRRMIRRLEELETAASDPIPCDGSWPHADLDVHEKAAERASLEELIRIIQTAGRVTDAPPRRRPFAFRASLLLPAAAVLAMAVLLPRQGLDKALVLDPGVVSHGAAREGARGIEIRREAESLRSGEEFHLRFSLTQAAHVFIVHVDASGQAGVVYPAALDAPLPRLPGGVELAVPDPNAGEFWVLDRNAGLESFIVVATASESVDEKEISALLAAASGSRDDRTAVLEQLTRQLSAYGFTRLIEFDHRD